MLSAVPKPAGNPVKFAPLIAGKAPVNCAAGKLVKLAPLPLNDVAVTTPALPALILLPISNCPLLNVNPRLCKFDTPVLKFVAVNIPVTKTPSAFACALTDPPDFIAVTLRLLKFAPLQ